MADIAQQAFIKNLFALLEETFEGPGGNIYLDKGAGLFQTLDALKAEAASYVPCAGAQTIAAHCAHLAYYVRVNHNYAMGQEQDVDWPSSRRRATPWRSWRTRPITSVRFGTRSRIQLG
jgi:hypothetical protein